MLALLLDFSSGLGLALLTVRFLCRSGLSVNCLAMGCLLTLVLELHVTLVPGEKAVTLLLVGPKLVLSTQGLATLGAVQGWLGSGAGLFMAKQVVQATEHSAQQQQQHM